jgi:hypothetical protein
MAKFFVVQQCSPARHTPKLWHYKQPEQTLMAPRCTPLSSHAATPEELARAHKQSLLQKFLV